MLEQAAEMELFLEGTELQFFKMRIMWMEAGGGHPRTRGLKLTLFTYTFQRGWDYLILCMHINSQKAMEKNDKQFPQYLALTLLENLFGNMFLLCFAFTITLETASISEKAWIIINA